MLIQAITIDFHVTSECSQECPYCWGPQDFENPASTDTSLAIIDRVNDVDTWRMVFTGATCSNAPASAR